ncbi:hypothetical protein CQA66_01960 [Helicobacter aurati]|uniref:Uncharacterized protein n=1 Tax=Helicobacter aurati TaxID=137778 RepID=A0A3D8J7H8_9HELI|nr:hypothetical protein [Helicobacter aurati]RDU73449.1 hypothetical protein CQA66_01960 [Helicobacter aurati]
MFELQPQDFKKDGDVGIYLHCHNIFLSISLGFYLKGHLNTLDKADFIITDVVNLEKKYTHLPVCMIGRDLYTPCSVYEMFAQLHDFYSHVNAKQVSIFQQDLQHINQNERNIISRQNTIQQSLIYQEQRAQNALIESIKQEKMRELLRNTNPELSGQIEVLFDELSQKIYETLNQHGKK